MQSLVWRIHTVGMLTLDVNNQWLNCTPSVLVAAISDPSDIIYLEMYNLRDLNNSEFLLQTAF